MSILFVNVKSRHTEHPGDQMIRNISILLFCGVTLGFNSAWAQLTADIDRDSVLDVFDNCLNVANSSQSDTDNDGYGNACDGDFNNDSYVNGSDFSLFIAAFGSTTGFENINMDDYTGVTGSDFGRFLNQLNLGRPGPSNGFVWLNPVDLSVLPMQGLSWENLLRYANQPASTPDLSDQEDMDNVRVLAKALVYAKTGQAQYRSQVITAINQIRGTEDRVGSRTLSVARELGSYILAADLVRLDAQQRTSFGQFIRTVISKTLPGGRAGVFSLIGMIDADPSNWGTHARSTVLIAALYLKDRALVERVANATQNWAGRNASSFSFGDDLSWHPSTTRLYGINPVGARINGYNVDGVLPDDQRRAGPFSHPFPLTNYAYEALQGALLTTELLHLRGYDSYNWSSRAILRAFNWLYYQGNFPAVADDIWMMHIINHRYGTNFPAAEGTGPGKTVGFADWIY